MRIHKNTAKALLVTIGRDTSHDRLKVEQTGEAISTNGHVLLKAPPATTDSDAKDQQPVEAIIPGQVIETAIKRSHGGQKQEDTMRDDIGAARDQKGQALHTK